MQCLFGTAEVRGVTMSGSVSCTHKHILGGMWAWQVEGGVKWTALWSPQETAGLCLAAKLSVRPDTAPPRPLRSAQEAFNLNILPELILQIFFGRPGRTLTVFKIIMQLDTCTPQKFYRCDVECRPSFPRWQYQNVQHFASRYQHFSQNSHL